VQSLAKVTSKEDIAGALNKKLGVTYDSKDLSKSLRANRSGLQIATLILPTTTANMLLDKGKIRIGWVI